MLAASLLPMLGWAIALMLGAYALLLGAIWWKQESLIFQPVPLAADHRFDLPPDAHELFIDVPGARLNALHLKQPGARGVVFFLHGNAGNLDSWFVNLDFYRSLGMDLFMIDYRGFGKSSGRIEGGQQLRADVRAAWDHVAPMYAGRHLVLLGRSLGTGLAAELAADLVAEAATVGPSAQRPGLLVLVSPYRSMVAMAAELYPYVPGALLRYPLRTDQALQALAGSGLQIELLHGEHDEVIPLSHAEALARAVPAVRLHRVAGAGHGDLQAFDAYQRALRAAMAAAAP